MPVINESFRKISTIILLRERNILSKIYHIDPKLFVKFSVCILLLCPELIAVHLTLHDLHIA